MAVGFVMGGNVGGKASGGIVCWSCEVVSMSIAAAEGETLPARIDKRLLPLSPSTPAALPHSKVPAASCPPERLEQSTNMSEKEYVLLAIALKTSVFFSSALLPHWIRSHFEQNSPFTSTKHSLLFCSTVINSLLLSSFSILNFRNSVVTDPYRLMLWPKRTPPQTSSSFPMLYDDEVQYS